MSDIIEKLGITPIESYFVYGEEHCSAKEVRDLEKQRNEMLKALIDLINGPCGEDISQKTAQAIDAVTESTGRSWEEAKKLLEEK